MKSFCETGTFARKVAHFGIVLKRSLDSPREPREIDDIISTGRSENGKEIFTKAEVCETAFAYGGSNATCFLSLDLDNNGSGDFNRWGWTNGPLSEGSYEFEIWAAAGQCDTSKGTLAGTLSVNYYDGIASVTFNMNPGFTMDEAQLYVGSDILPKNVNDEYTVAPGQYPIVEDLTDATTATYTVSGLSGNIYVVAHAVTCWYE